MWFRRRDVQHLGGIYACSNVCVCVCAHIDTYTDTCMQEDKPLLDYEHVPLNTNLLQISELCHPAWNPNQTVSILQLSHLELRAIRKH